MFPLEYIKRNNASNITIEDLIVNLGHDQNEFSSVADGEILNVPPRTLFQF